MNNVLEDVKMMLAEQGYTLGQIPTDRLERELRETPASEGWITVKVPSYSEVSFTREEARAILQSRGR